MKSFTTFLEVKIEESKTAKETLQDILAILRAQHWLYYNAHWTTKGKEFYEQHILFQRLYESLPEQFDSLAEKMVSYFGEEVISSDQMKQSQTYLDKWSSDNLIKSGIDAEKDLQEALQKGYDKLKNSKEITLGLDDYLMGLANDHETHLYLLGQMLGLKREALFDTPVLKRPPLPLGRGAETVKDPESLRTSYLKIWQNSFGDINTPEAQEAKKLIDSGNFKAAWIFMQRHAPNLTIR